MNMTRVIVVVLGLCTPMAKAIPTWIGVYGSEQRHAAGNPGTYTILMNQSYPGLRAAVGIQVNGGSWREYPMSYVGMKDQNSKWQFSPTIEYPEGATVRYYFHGWDEQGGHMWDSNGGKDYFLTAPVSPAWVFSEPEELTFLSGVAQGVQFAAFGGRRYAAWTETDDNSGGPARIRMAVKQATGSWSAPVELISAPSFVSVDLFDVRSNGMHLVSGTNYYRSADFGMTWTSIALPGYGVVRVFDEATWLINGEYETGTRLYRLPANRTVWEGPIRTGLDASLTIDDFVARGHVLALAAHRESYGYTAHWYSFEYQYIESTNGGATWTTNLYPSAVTKSSYMFQSMTKLALRSDGTLHLFGLGYDNGLWSFSRKPGAGASWSSRYPLWNGGMPSALLDTASGLVAINGAREYRVAPDGTDWNYTRLAGQDDIPLNGRQCIAAADNQLFLGLSRGYYPTSRYYAVTARPYTGGLTRTLWIGNQYPWPVNGQPEPGKDTWVNIEAWPMNSAVGGYVLWTTNQINWNTTTLTPDGTRNNNSAWHGMIGRFSAGTTIRYAYKVYDALGNFLWDTKDGANYKLVVSGGSAVQWAGNIYSAPGPMEKFRMNYWVNIETWPAGAAVTARVVYSVDAGKTWNSAPMERWTSIGNNDGWHGLVSTIYNPADIRYAIEVVDGKGNSVWNTNGGNNYRVDQ